MQCLFLIQSKENTERMSSQTIPWYKRKRQKQKKIEEGLKTVLTYFGKMVVHFYYASILKFFFCFSSYFLIQVLPLVSKYL